MPRQVSLVLAVLVAVTFAAQDAALDICKDQLSTAPAAQQAFTDRIAIPRLLSYQGKLTDSLGEPVPDTTWSIMFLLSTQPSGGTSFWNETQSVVTENGLFSVLLGSTTPIETLPEAGTLYLGMAVGGTELTPRLRIASAAYAFLAQDARHADTADYASGGIFPDSLGASLAIRGELRVHTKAFIGHGCRNNGEYAFCTGYDCGARGDRSSVTGGEDNSCSGRAAHIGGGSENSASGPQSTIGGGYVNVAQDTASTVAGGWENVARGDYSTVGGGMFNAAESAWATVGGGNYNLARGMHSAVGGGESNTAYAPYATIAGGRSNNTDGWYAAVGGGAHNEATASYATIGGGFYNTAGDGLATVGGGENNAATGNIATVAGGSADTSAGYCSFTTGSHSVVASSHSNSAAFNGQTTTASNQTRVGVLSKASGSFTIDHPQDPYGKILNHYFIEGPEMRNIYEGTAVLDGSGRAEVRLPDYFDALNQNPRIQLTGVGTFEVYVVDKVVGNRFTIGGPAGVEVYWQVTGERKDVSAEATRRMMPVEQPKSGDLAGRMLDDEFISGCMDQLEREGKTEGIGFRTAGGRARYERMKQDLREPGQR